jgi:two-component system, OmpR family, response regulator VicR
MASISFDSESNIQLSVNVRYLKTTSYWEVAEYSWSQAQLLVYYLPRYLNNSELLCPPAMGEYVIRQCARAIIWWDDFIPANPPGLIVDDDLVVLGMLRTVLQKEGFAVVGANNAIAALYLLQRTPVALVLTDFMMPGLSGLELADHLRHDPRTATVPVILMCAFPPPDAGTRVAALIRKPFALDDLLRLVRQFWPH